MPGLFVWVGQLVTSLTFVRFNQGFHEYLKVIKYSVTNDVDIIETLPYNTYEVLHQYFESKTYDFYIIGSSNSCKQLKQLSVFYILFSGFVHFLWSLYESSDFLDSFNPAYPIDSPFMQFQLSRLTERLEVLLNGDECEVIDTLSISGTYFFMSFPFSCTMIVLCLV